MYMCYFDKNSNSNYKTKAERIITIFLKRERYGNWKLIMQLKGYLIG